MTDNALIPKNPRPSDGWSCPECGGTLEDCECWQDLLARLPESA